MNFEKELRDILTNDPLDLLKPKQTNPIITEDDRLRDSFLEINNFFEKEKREPEESANMNERRLYVRLKEMKKDPDKVLFLKEFDMNNFLGEAKEINSVDDIMEDDYLGILEDDVEDIFEIKHFSKPKDKADFVARRTPCKDFPKYEEQFKQIHKDLKEGKRKLLTFKDMDLREGGYYVLDGMIVFLEKINIQTRVLNDRTQGTRKRQDGRIRCIFENATESNMYLRSLQKQLYNNGSTISTTNDEDIKAFNENLGQVSEGDKITGHIYILSSLSDKPEIQNIKNLYKIGYCTTSVEERIKSAENDPTYLMSAVKIITTFDVYNINPQKFENLVHTVFRQRCLDVKIADPKGSIKKPKEWYVVPIRVILKTIELIISGKIINYKYDTKIEDLVEKNIVNI